MNAREFAKRLAALERRVATLKRHRRGAVLGRGALGRHALVPVNLEPIRRARIAATVSKIPALQYTATFAHRRRPHFDEMQFGMGFDEFIDRTSW